MIILVLLVTFANYQGLNIVMATSGPNIEQVLAAAKTISNNRDLLEDEDIIAIIEDKNIYKGELELKKKLYEVTNKLTHQDDYKIPFTQLMVEKYELALAEKLGLSVSIEEAQEIALKEKELIYSSGETSAIKMYIDSLGLTEDEYWNEYAPGELIKYVTHVRIERHIIEEAVKNKKLPKVEMHTAETNELYHQYIDNYYKNLKKQIKYKLVDTDYAEKIK